MPDPIDAELRELRAFLREQEATRERVIARIRELEHEQARRQKGDRSHMRDAEQDDNFVLWRNLKRECRR